MSQEPKIRALRVDDHAVVRPGLRLFSERQADMEVAGEGSWSWRCRRSLKST